VTSRWATARVGDAAVPGRAGAVTRLAAFFADAVVLAIGLRVTGWLLRAMPRVLGRFAPPVSLDEILAALVPTLVAIYLVGFWTVLGRTPGKILMGIEVVPLAGGRMTFKRSLVRLVGYVISALPVYLGFLWMLGPSRRGWHDILARTEVAYVRRHAASTVVTAAELRARMQASVRRPAFAAPLGPARRLGPAAGSRP
jgi:uncharacterized RDD family membrane protein YckC